jgi:hypothetical protein
VIFYVRETREEGLWMQKLRWGEMLKDPLYRDRWVALTDCTYRDDVLEECVVVDSDDDIAVLEQRLEERDIKNCTIKRVSEGEERPSETPRVTRSGPGSTGQGT